MADVLAHMKEKALSEVNPRLFTWATLTGHVIVAHGAAYTVSARLCGVCRAHNNILSGGCS